MNDFKTVVILAPVFYRQKENPPVAKIFHQKRQKVLDGTLNASAIISLLYRTLILLEAAMDIQPKELNSQPRGLSVYSRSFPYVSTKTTALTPLVLQKRVYVWIKRNNDGLVS